MKNILLIIGLSLVGLYLIISVDNINRHEFINEVCRVGKKDRYSTTYGVPMDEKGRPILSLKTLNKLEKKYGIGITDGHTYQLAININSRN